MKRTAAMLAAIFLACLFLSGCSPQGRKNSAARIINKDLNGITELARSVLENGAAPESSTITGVLEIEYAAPDWVSFCTGSREDEDGAAVCGFYFSPEDRPMTFPNEEMELASDGSGWSWEESETHRYYTERIQFNWYYYEMYF